MVRQEVELCLVRDPDDPGVAQLTALLERTLADPNTVLGADRMREFLNEAPDGTRQFHVLVARRGTTLVGGSVFSYVRASNCGFSEYIAVDAVERGTGLGRRLFDMRKAVLDEQARQGGESHCDGLFIEVDNPDRTPTDLLEAERETALDARQRLSLFAHLGFKRVHLRYVQPPLAPGKRAVDYMDLLFAPWPRRDSIRATSVLETLAPIWTAWAPGDAAAQLAKLRAEIGDDQVALTPLF